MHTPKYGVEMHTKLGLPTRAGCEAEADETASTTAEMVAVTATAKNTKIRLIVTSMGLS